MSNLTLQIEQEVTAAVQQDKLELPTLPEVALRVREEAEDDNVSAQSLANVIGADPGLAARIVRVANSPLYRAARPIDDLKTALGRLGVDQAATLATGFAMQQMFQATSDIIDKKLRKIWMNATEVAAISGVLAKTFTSLRPDQATLAGLTHSIGVLPILAWAEENSSLLNDSLTLDRVIESLHGSLGTMILQSWGFPDDIALVPSHYANFARTANDADYVDVIMVANLQHLAGSNHPYTQQDWTQITSFGRLGLDPDREAGEMTDYDEDVAAARESIV